MANGKPGRKPVKKQLSEEEKEKKIKEAEARLNRQARPTSQTDKEIEAALEKTGIPFEVLARYFENLQRPGVPVNHRMYHVKAGTNTIYCGRIKFNLNGAVWANKNLCTQEALEAVRDYFVQQCLNNDSQEEGVTWEIKGGAQVRLYVEIVKPGDLSRHYKVTGWPRMYNISRYPEAEIIEGDLGEDEPMFAPGETNNEQ